MTEPTYEPAEIEAGRKLFVGDVDFVLGVRSMSQLPAGNLPEVAFAGRSNVGKSSLLNALTGRKQLARTSNTPGRTREVNFFDAGGRLMLADLPGYGYAKVSKTEVEAWTRLIEDYLRGRVQLRRCCLLIDARHGLKDSDRTAMKMMDQAAQNYQVVLTKCDKIKPGPLKKLIAATSAELATHGAAHPQIMCTSSRDSAGIAELRAELAKLAE
ncbi:MAG: YihA family ribosome biogenesis GTP-binding protein [Rhodospirillales bacterium]|nr:YihA family ribosome biogenesis GTP-binding protein [Rhodospirillales bacterium]MBO6787933.1 YihA family ribosome biogenesis GTP-binding protein [Rhodospirillales bacterium]